METSNKKEGCFKIIGIILVIATVMQLYENLTFRLSNLEGEWIYTTSEYNPFSLGGVIQKGNYPVNYILKIESDDTYKLFYGSPGFEKMKTYGDIKKNIFNGVTLKNFDPKNKDQKDYYVNKFKRNNGVIESFCINSEPNNSNCFQNYSRR